MDAPPGIVDSGSVAVGGKFSLASAVAAVVVVAAGASAAAEE